MKPSEDLFLLIKRLSGSEKAAFTKSAQSGKDEGEFAYLKLFKALDKVSENDYDEVEFIRAMEGEPFIKNFSQSKKELYDKILDVLRARKRSRGTEKPLEFQARELLEDAWNLREKKLFDQSEKRLQKARKMAESHQFHEVLLEILRLERTVLMGKSPKDEALIRDLHHRIAETNRDIQSKFRLLELHDQFFLLIRKHSDLSGNLDLEELGRLISAPELQNIALCLTPEAQSNYHLCHAIYHYLLDDSLASWRHARAQYLIWQENKTLQKVKRREHRNVLQNYLSFCNEALRYDDFEVALGQLDKGPFLSANEESSAIHNSLNVRIHRDLNLCRWEDVQKTRGEYRKDLGHFSDGLIPSRMLTFYLSFSKLDLVMGLYRDAEKWAGKVLTDGPADFSNGLIFEAYLLQALALYMQGLHDQTEKKCRHILEKFRHLSQKDSFEKRVINILRRCPDIQDPQKANREFSELLDSFAKKLKAGRLGDSILRAWVTSRVQGIPIKNVLESELPIKLEKARKAVL